MMANGIFFETVILWRAVILKWFLKNWFFVVEKSIFTFLHFFLIFCNWIIILFHLYVLFKMYLLSLFVCVLGVIIFGFVFSWFFFLQSVTLSLNLLILAPSIIKKMSFLLLPTKVVILWHISYCHCLIVVYHIFIPFSSPRSSSSFISLSRFSFLIAFIYVLFCFSFLLPCCLHSSVQSLSPLPIFFLSIW